MLIEKDVDWKELFEWFHRHPETAYQEVKTTEKISNILREAEIEIQESDIGTGIGAALHNPQFQVDFNAFLPASNFLADIMSGQDE